jgi:hypothetical protein
VRASAGTRTATRGVGRHCATLWDNATVTDRSVDEVAPGPEAREAGNVVVVGGASFARSLAAHGRPEPLRLELVGTTTYGDGPVFHPSTTEPS